MKDAALGGLELPAQRGPHLVLRFVVVTTLALLIAGGATVVFVQRELTGQAQRQASERARGAASAILSQLIRPGDIVERLSARRRERFVTLFAPGRLGKDHLGASLYAAKGRAVFSTTIARAAKPSAASLRTAREGHVVSEVVSSRTGRVLRTFMPVSLRGSTKAVIVLDQDFGPIAAGARKLSLLIAALFEGLLFALIVVLAPVLGHAGARLRRQVEVLDHLASHDLLTGLTNRLGFRRLVDDAAARKRPAGSLLLVDLESFHDINAIAGSNSGDRLLAQVADRLREELGASAALARLGEDEFGLLLDTDDGTEIAAVAERVRKALADPFQIGGVRIGVDARFGAARFRENAANVDALLREASVALMVAKEQGQNLELYDPSHDARDLWQLAQQTELREALEQGELVVHYQPQVDVATHVTRGVEALIRWRHPVRGILPASEFIGQAERSGLISQLNRFVLNTGMRQWQRWEEQGIRLELAVNLAGVDLLDAFLPDYISALLQEHGVPPEYLVLEVTERILMHEQQRAMVDRLDRRGITIAIDDYGTGFSSLAALRELPIRQVKIDRRFLVGIPEDERNETIVRSTIQLAHALGATVVAEGVESERQLHRLKEFGCDIAQGYWIGRPLASNKLTALLRTRQVPLAQAGRQEPALTR